MPLTYPELGDSDAGFDLRKIHQLQVILLYNPVPNRRNAQQTLTAVILGDGYAPDWLRPIALFLQLEQQARQLHLQIRLKRTQALPIDSGRALVALDVSEGFIQALF